MRSFWRLKIALLLIIMTSTACSFAVSPVDLLKAPSVSTDLQEMRQAIHNELPTGAKLTIPEQLESVKAAIIEADLDGDGINEAIAFYKKEINQFEFGVLVLSKKEGKWKKIADIKELGSSVQFVDFKDVTGDGTPVMLVGWSGGEDVKKELTVYQMKEGTVQDIGRFSYTELAIGDLDNNGIADIVLIQQDRNLMNAKAELYKYEEGRIRLSDEHILDGGVGGYIQVLFGKATASRNGIFITAQVGAHSSFTTLLVKEDGRLKDVFGDTKQYVMLSPYGVIHRDINQDEIIEIASLFEPPANGPLPLVDVPWIHRWHQWDGQAGLNLVYENYYDYGAGFRFDFPAKWWGQYTIVKEEKEHLNLVRFYHVENEEKGREFFSLAYYPVDDKLKNKIEWENQQMHTIDLGERNGQIFTAVIPRASQNSRGTSGFEALRLDDEEIISYFHFLPKE
ncbi:hypothetical protein [Paenibacillus senegalensis]|uniref:hypothetical protein n=1 Tax=Paenibacillus senegalensis TaxID=1465766 RepID=UPI000288C603|nr:hypothetical protein [Paenibacillus senegalensis]